MNGRQDGRRHDLRMQRGIRPGRWIPGLVAATLVTLIGLALGGAAGSPNPAERAADRREIHLNGFHFDPLLDSPDLPAGLRLGSGPGDGPGYHIVQFRDAVTSGMKRQLQGAGAVPLHYVSFDAFIVRADRPAIDRARRLPVVRWTGPFQPAFTFSPRLDSAYDQVLNSDLERRRLLNPESASDLPRIDTSARIPVHIVTMEAASVREIARTVERLGGTGLVRSTHGSGLVRAEVPRGALESLARTPGVLWIDREEPNVLVNDQVRWVIQSGDPVSLATPMHDRGLWGSGQTVTIADSGLRVDHPAFGDPSLMSPGPQHRKVTDYYIPPGAVGDLRDNPDFTGFGHGTHVSGTVAGDDGTYHVYDGNPRDLSANVLKDGQAFDAFIQIQDISVSDTFVYPPADLHDLFGPAIVPTRNSWIHTNSWGGTSGHYADQAAQTDDFVWDNPNFTILFAAGNSGPGPFTLLTQATAKNVITVGGSGASYVLDAMMFCHLSGAYCSSRGPVADGRLKPDVLAPGQLTKSAFQSGGYTAATGTSMATPAVAGAATLVRQHFTDGWYPAGEARPGNGFTPSAALVKTLLVHSGTEISGASAYANNESRYPNNSQGWGRIRLQDAINEPRDYRPTIVHDNRTGLATGEPFTYTLLVRDVTHPLEATLTWSDAPGTPGVTPNLVNDLDLKVIAPSGTIYLGNRFTGFNPGHSDPNPTGSICAANPAKQGGGDCLNNVEGVFLPPPYVEQGTWTIEVRGDRVPVGAGNGIRQPYALAYTAFATTPKGVLWLQSGAYNTTSTAYIEVSDSDRNLSRNSIDTLTVEVRSTTEGIPEVVTLLEGGNDTGIFSGPIPLHDSPTPVQGDGRLQIRLGDIITASYFDASDGLGGSSTSSDTALIENTPPVISGVQAVSIGLDSATIVWTTNEPADTRVRYGLFAPPGNAQSDNALVTSHSLALLGLADSATYYYQVESMDQAGNRAVANNNGQYYRFITPFTAVADHQTGPGTITQGSYLDTHRSDDVREALRETKQGSKSRLLHVWRFGGLPIGQKALIFEGYAAGNGGGDNFQFSYSTDGSSYTNIPNALVSLSVEYQSEVAFGADSLSGTFYIRLQDTVADETIQDTVFIDLLAIRDTPPPPCADADADGYTPSCAGCANTLCPAIDCSDADPLANPGRIEGPAGDPTCSDGRDNDCDDGTDAADAACSGSARDRLDPNGDVFVSGVQSWEIFPTSPPRYAKIDEGFPTDGADYIFIPENSNPQERVDAYDLANPSTMATNGRTTTLMVEVAARGRRPKKQDNNVVGITLIVDGTEQGETVVQVPNDEVYHTLTFTNPGWNGRSWTKAQVDGMRFKIRGRTSPGGSAHAVGISVSSVQVTVDSQVP